MTEGTFPEALKLSIIKPVLKKGESDVMDNYRPIALISIHAKIFEKAMYERIYKFLEKYNVLAKEQNGFRKGKSTSLAAFNLIKNVTENIDKNIETVAIFFDMSKAFDFVSHDILLCKCEKYGLRGNALKWLQTYLQNRSQYVEIKYVNSSKEEITSKSPPTQTNIGIPQGTILGPLLFIIYINDLPCVTSYQCNLFADDISVVIPKSPNIMFDETINATITLIAKWLTANNLNINVGKTKLIRFYNRKPIDNEINIHINNEPIVESDEALFLGIVIDNQCSWKKHISKICAKINRFAYALWRLATLVNQKAALMAYHGYVASNLKYGLILWGNSTAINKAFISQKQCVRAMCNAPPMTSCKQLFPKLNLLTLPSLYIFECCIFVKTHPHLFLQKDNQTIRSIRYPGKLLLPKMQTTLYKNNCYPSCIQIYNKLPHSLTEVNLVIFRRKLFDWLKVKCFYSIKEYFSCKIDI